MSLKSQYELIAKDRKAYEDRAEKNAEVSLQSIFPIESFTANDGYKTNYAQAVGGTGVTALASKLVFSLIPPQGRFFRMSPDADALNELSGGNQNAKSEVYSILSQGEAKVLKEIENQNIRTSAYEVLKALIVTGNVLMEKLPNNGIKVHSLRNYVVERGTDGEPVKIILKELISPYNPPKELESFVDVPEEGVDPEDLELFTGYIYAEGKWTMTQELEEEVVGKEVTYKDTKKLPVKPLGWSFVNNEDFARAYIDEFLGFLIQFNKSSEIMVEGSFASAKVVYTVNPLGVTRKKDVAGASNLDIIDGKADDVTAIQTMKGNDMSMVMRFREEIRREIGKRFLDNSAIQRDAERVTAEEIQVMAKELETTLSGTFSLLSVDLLRTIVIWIMDELNIESGDGVGIDITVGLDALSRSREADLLMQYVSAIYQLQYQDYLNESEIVSRLSKYMGVNSVDLNLSPDEVKNKRQEAAQAAQAQQLSMSRANELGNQSVQQEQGVQ